MLSGVAGGVRGRPSGRGFRGDEGLRYSSRGDYRRERRLDILHQEDIKKSGEKKDRWVNLE